LSPAAPLQAVDSLSEPVLGISEQSPASKYPTIKCLKHFGKYRDDKYRPVASQGFRIPLFITWNSFGYLSPSGKFPSAMHTLINFVRGWAITSAIYFKVFTETPFTSRAPLIILITSQASNVRDRDGSPGLQYLLLDHQDYDLPTCDFVHLT
jgi:hypothetical protein